MSDEQLSYFLTIEVTEDDPAPGYTSVTISRERYGYGAVVRGLLTQDDTEDDPTWRVQTFIQGNIDAALKVARANAVHDREEDRRARAESERVTREEAEQAS
jgi:hypothetical protein